MATRSSLFKDNKQGKHRKKTRQGMGRGTKFGVNKHSTKRYKKRYRGQGK